MNIPTPTSQTVETARSASQTWSEGSWGLGPNSGRFKGCTALKASQCCGRIVLWEPVRLWLPDSPPTEPALPFSSHLCPGPGLLPLGGRCLFHFAASLVHRNFWWAAAPRDSCNWPRAAEGQLCWVRPRRVQHPRFLLPASSGSLSPSLCPATFFIWHVSYLHLSLWDPVRS